MTSRSALERRHRKSARIALYSSLSLTILLGLALISLVKIPVKESLVIEPGSQAWADVDWGAQPVVQLLQGYLQVDTNWETGSEIAGARYLAGVLEAAGIEAHIEELGNRHANLWAILEGEEPGALVLHNHIDVEPIRRPEKWKHAPFGGEIQAPWIYGRGVFDMKSLAVAQLEAMLDLKSKGVRPRKSLIFLATGSEEVGSDLGARWILRHHPKLVERFEAVLTEGGVVEAIDREAVKYWGISFAQKRYVKLTVCSPSSEELLEIRQQVRDRRLWKPQLPILTEPALTMLADYSSSRGRPDLQELLAHPERVHTDNRAFMLLPRYLQAMLRNEVFTGQVRETSSGYEMSIDIHVLPGQDIDEVRRDVVPDWALEGVSWAMRVEPAKDGGSSTSHPAFITLLEGVRSRYPGANVGPYFLPWTATDARFFRYAGIPAYGFSPFLILTPDTMTGNSPNERIALPAFTEGVAMYSELVEEIVNGDQPWPPTGVSN